MDCSRAWLKANIPEPLGFVDDDMNTVGVIVLHSGAPTILSLDPGADFELNTDIIHQWMVVFQNSEGDVLGDTDYQTLLREIKPYILDQQNGSILIRALNDDELEELHASTVFE